MLKFKHCLSNSPPPTVTVDWKRVLEKVAPEFRTAIRAEKARQEELYGKLADLDSAYARAFHPSWLQPYALIPSASPKLPSTPSHGRYEERAGIDRRLLQAVKQECAAFDPRQTASLKQAYKQMAQARKDIAAEEQAAQPNVAEYLELMQRVVRVSKERIQIFTEFIPAEDIRVHLQSQYLSINVSVCVRACRSRTFTKGFQGPSRPSTRTSRRRNGARSWSTRSSIPMVRFR